MSTTSSQGSRYFVTFIDTKTRFITVYFLHNRAAIPDVTIRHMEYIHTAHGKYPRFFRSDNAREYTSSTLQKALSARGITHITTAPYTPQQNSLAERINLTLMDTVRANLTHSNLSDKNWQFALMDAVFKRNITLHSTTNKIPYTEWYGMKPNIKRLFAFGQIGHIPIPNPTTKLEDRGTLVRYLAETDQDNILVAKTKTNQTLKIAALDFHPYTTMTDPTATTPFAFHTTKANPKRRNVPQHITPHTPAPSKHRLARQYPDAHLWSIAHDSELAKIDQMRAIDWIPRSLTHTKSKPIPLKMTYRYKRDSNGHIEERKARCAVRGDLMKPNMHFDPNNTATFAADKTSIRLLLAHAAAHRLHRAHKYLIRLPPRGI